jgi:hypothetical protein
MAAKKNVSEIRDLVGTGRYGEESRTSVSVSA